MATSKEYNHTIRALYQLGNHLDHLPYYSTSFARKQILKMDFAQTTPRRARPVVNTDTFWSLSGEGEKGAELSVSGRGAAERLRDVARDSKGMDVRQTLSGKWKVYKACVTPWMAFKMMFSGYIHPVEQVKISHIIQDYDTAPEPVEQLVKDDRDGENVRRPRHSNANWWVGYSRIARAQKHQPSHTRANELVVSALIQRLMEADGVRRCDIAKVIALATHLAFMPSEDELLIPKFNNAPAARARLDKMQKRYWSAWWGKWRDRYESG